MASDPKEHARRDYESELRALQEAASNALPADVREAIELSAKVAEQLPTESVTVEVNYEGSGADT